MDSARKKSRSGQARKKYFSGKNHLLVSSCGWGMLFWDNTRPKPPGLLEAAKRHASRCNDASFCRSLRLPRLEESTRRAGCLTSASACVRNSRLFSLPVCGFMAPDVATPLIRPNRGNAPPRPLDRGPSRRYCLQPLARFRMWLSCCGNLQPHAALLPALPILESTAPGGLGDSINVHFFEFFLRRVGPLIVFLPRLR